MMRTSLIEANLELDCFSEDGQLATAGAALDSAAFFPPETYRELQHDIRAHFQFIHSEPPGHDCWLERLTPFEAQTRALVLDLVTLSVRHRFPVDMPDSVLREVLNYTMTTGWFVFTGLVEQYTRNEDDGPRTSRISRSSTSLICSRTT